MNKKGSMFLSFLLVLSVLLGACAPAPQNTEAPTQAPAQKETASPAPGAIANPASTYCEEHGGKLDIRTAADGSQSGVCVFPDGSECDEWAFYRGECTPAKQPAAVSGKIDCMSAQKGDEVTVFYQWSGTEEEQLKAILQPLVDACGIVIKPEASRDQALVDTRVKAGTPYDIIFFNLIQMRQYESMLKPVTDLGVTGDNYADYWRDLGTVNGKWLALPVKADVKSIIWYNPVNFEAFGYTVPTTWEELNTEVDKMAADDNVPWSMGLESSQATGWTGSDFIQDILLVQQGPQYVLDIISGKVLYNDAGVKQAYETYGRWAKDPKYAVGGAKGTLTTGFRDAIFAIVKDPPDAMMVKQSGFAGSEIAKEYPNLKAGTDYDFFQVPGVQGLQGGSDWMMAFSDKPAVKAIFAYLSSDLGGQNWAKEGFGLTPNAAGLPLYDPKTSLGKMAKMLSETKGFTPDIGDSIPGGFGTAEWKAIVDYLNGADLQEALDQAANAQKEALAGE